LGFVWDTAQDIHSRLEQGRALLNLPYYIEIFIIAAWEIWNIRNGKFFEGAPVNLQLWTMRFKAQVILQINRVSEDHRPQIVQWLNTIL
jgi:hypothetical protein